MLGEFYKEYHIVGSATYSEDRGRWTPWVSIYPPVRISLNPTVLAGEESSFATEAQAEQQAVRMGKNWIDRQAS
jgi:hypothetical protein